MGFSNMWQCLKCHEESEDSFDACWACGASRDGVMDPSFQLVVDQPELSTDPGTVAAMHGQIAGAAVGMLLAFVHPFIMLLFRQLVQPVAISASTIIPLLLSGFVWAIFAAVSGGIAGTIGARTQNERTALVAGLLSGALSHMLFLSICTNAFGSWPSSVVFASLSLAALAGTLAGFAGFIVGKRCRAQCDAKTPV
jgi:hypothetical protein